MDDAKGIVFLVDDEPAVLRALSTLLAAAGYDTRSFSSPELFLKEHDPSVAGCAVLDLSMPGLNGLELQARLAQSGDARPVIFLTGNGEVKDAVTAMKGGAVDFLSKPVRRNELLSAVATAMARDVDERKRRQETSAIQERIALLTERQREVMLQVVAGRLNKQIASDLGTVEKTIKAHRSRIMAKMGVRTLADLVALTERAGIRRP